MSRSYIFLYDDTERSSEIMKRLSAHPNGSLIHTISATDPKKRAEILSGYLVPSGVVKGAEDPIPCFLVQQGGLAIYNASSVGTVLELAGM